MKRFALYTTFAVISTALAVAGEVDYQKLANRIDFGWREEQSTFLYSLSRMPDDYKFQMEYDPAKNRMTFSLLKNERTAFTYSGHKHSVFRIHNGVLYYPAAFHYSASGCKIVAYDLEKKHEVWKTSLKGIGPVFHSAYRNFITLDVSDDVVTVRGHESLGDYLEILDRTSGEMVGHRTFNMRFNREKTP